MTIAVFSDVHANLEALSAVVESIRESAIDEAYCLGDVVGYGASPDACVDMVRKVARATVLGNHDAAVAGRMDYSYYYDAAREALDAHANAISADNKAWLKALPYQVDLEQASVKLCHGSPVNPEEFEYIFAEEQAEDCLKIWHELPSLTLIGHSHLCKVFALGEDSVEEVMPTEIALDGRRKYIASVGSVGQPRDYRNTASYVTFEPESRVLRFLRVPYDIEAAAERIIDEALEKSFAHRLYIGV